VGDERGELGVGRPQRLEPGVGHSVRARKDWGTCYMPTR
jgi:hypothetical protein